MFDRIDPVDVLEEPHPTENPRVGGRLLATPAAEAEGDLGSAGVLQPRRRGSWVSVLTLPLICVGLAGLAIAILLPELDVNRQLAFERELLRADLLHLDQQISRTEDFIERLSSDPALVQRLARRQLNRHDAQTTLLSLPSSGGSFAGQSPFGLLAVSPPPPPPAYEPIGGRLSTLVADARGRLYVVLLSVLLLGIGLTLDAPDRSRQD